MIRQFSRLISLAFLAFAGLALSACSTMGIGELTEHLNARGCATAGNATASAGLTGATLGGNLAWRCNGAPAPQTGQPQPTATPGGLEIGDAF